jgi:transposase-like protein
MLSRSAIIARPCDRWFNDKTGTIFANSDPPLHMWFSAAFLLQFRVSVMDIAPTLGIGYMATFFMVKKPRHSLYAERIAEKLRDEGLHR